MIAASICSRSSGTTRYDAVHGDATASAKNCRMAGPLRSSYTPPLARSLTVSTPNLAASPTLEASPPPCSSGGGGAMGAGCAMPLSFSQFWGDQAVLGPQLSADGEY